MSWWVWQCTDDEFVKVVKTFLGTFLVLTYLYTAISITRSLVQEKELRLKEAMMMMGLSNWVHWTAWFIKHILFMFISVVMITCLLVYGNVFGNSEGIVLFVFFMLFAASTITFCFMVSTFFTKASTAAAGSGLAFFLAYTPYFFASSMNTQQKSLSCLLAPACLGFGVDIIAKFEISGQGLTSANIKENPEEDDDFTFEKVRQCVSVSLCI